MKLFNKGGRGVHGKFILSFLQVFSASSFCKLFISFFPYWSHNSTTAQRMFDDLVATCYQANHEDYHGNTLTLFHPPWKAIHNAIWLLWLFYSKTRSIISFSKWKFPLITKNDTNSPSIQSYIDFFFHPLLHLCSNSSPIHPSIHPFL